MNEANNVKRGKTFNFSLRTLIIVGFLLVIIFIGSILGTYFGKVCKDCDQNLPSKCQSLYCSETNINWKNVSCESTHLTTKSPTTIIPAKEIEYRLPEKLRPYHYDLTIKPYFSALTRPEVYDGQVKIFFSTSVETSQFKIHSIDHKIDFSSVLFENLADSNETFPHTTSYDNSTGILTFDLSEPEIAFKPGYNYTFFVKFKAFPNDNLVGFYRSSYLESNGTKKWLMTSQLSYIEARKSFPCFDEPTFKAVFKIRIIHDSSLTAISNMPVASKTSLPLSSDGFNWVETEFKPTIKMSTYLIGILISDFYCIPEIVNTPLSGRVDLEVCARPNAVNQVDYALEASLTMLSVFEEYFKYPFPLPKLDHATVPTFKFGAMENWGIILYAEQHFLFNKTTGTQDAEMNIIQAMAHEVAHMWFGNLVTHKWWDDIFLKEGFAVYYEYRLPAKLRPHWRMMDMYHDLLINIIQSDSSNFTREITLDVNSPEEIDSQFDPIITYGKGTAVIKMVAYILGEETFSNGLYKYFNKYALSNVDQFDLWNTLYEEAVEEGKLKDVNLTEIMSSWTKQKGHPVVTVRRMGNDRIGVTQNRFITDTTVDVALLRNIKWYIPFTYSIERLGSLSSITNQINETNLFSKFQFISPDTLEEIIILDEDLRDDNFIIANLDMAGFYRVQYDEANWRLIIRQLSSHIDQLSPRTRSSLISDVFSLTEAGYFDKPIAFDLSTYLVNEFDFLPWSTFICRIKFYTNLFESTSSYRSVQQFLRSLVKPYYTKLGWTENIEKDLWTDRLIRNKLFSFACRQELPECLNQANDYFRDWKQGNNKNEIPKGLLPLVTCIGISQGNESDFNYLFNQMKATNDKDLRANILASLACTKDPILQLSLLDFQLKANTSDIFDALMIVANRPVGFVTSWNYLKRNWDYLYSNFNSSSKFPTLIGDISLRMKYNYELDDMSNFFASKQLIKPIRDEVDEAISRINSNIKWFNTNAKIISEWLYTYKQ